MPQDKWFELNEILTKTRRVMEARMEALVTAIEVLMKKIEAEQTMFSPGCGGNTIEEEQLQVLLRIRAQLMEQQNYISRVVEGITAERTEGDFSGKANIISVIPERAEEKARQCERLSQEVGESVSYVGDLHRQASEEIPYYEMAEIEHALDEYRAAASQLIEVNEYAVNYLRNLKDAYCAMEDAPIQELLEKKEEKDIVLPPPQMDSVQFSAVAPEVAKPGNYFLLNILMYEDAFRKEVDAILGSGQSKEVKSGYCDVERNSCVKVLLTSPDIEIDDGEEERAWQGKYLNFEFAVMIPKDYHNPQILFRATIYINDIIATKLKLIVDCADTAKQDIQITREDILSAFVSYASQDRQRVATIIQGMKKARPDMDIFFDIESLRSGQKWEMVLKEEIEKRDVLFLCWSRFAKESKWVELEWRYALESKGEDAIEPIPIESPDVCPPPFELQQKHFNDRMLYIIKAASAPIDEKND